MIRVLHKVACQIVFILFYDRYWQRGVLKHMKNDHFFSIFSRFGLFHQVFGQVNMQPILVVNKIIKVLHLFVCPIVFILFYGLDWQGGVFKVMKNDHFLNIFISFGLFLRVFGQVNEWSILKLHEMIKVLYIFLYKFVFFYLMIKIGMEKLSNL